jgi:hypothetical protein
MKLIETIAIKITKGNRDLFIFFFVIIKVVLLHIQNALQKTLMAVKLKKKQRSGNNNKFKKNS